MHIFTQPLYRGKTPSTKESPEYDTKLYLVVKLQSGSSGEGEVMSSLLPLLPSQLWPGVVVTVKVPSINQIVLFEIFKIIVKFINILALKTLTLQISIKSLPV